MTSAVPDPSPQRARFAIAALLVVLAGTAHWLYWHQVLDWSPWSGDALEYSVVARRLAEGEGFTTPVIFPVELEFGATESHPSLMRAPLWSMATAGFLWVSGGAPAAVHAASLVSYLAILVASMALGRALAGNGVGILAGAVVAFTPHLMVYAIDGTSEAFFAAIVTTVFALWARGVHPFFVGAACGFAYLARYNGAVVAAGVALALLTRSGSLRERASAVASLSIGVLLVAVPWWARNFIVTGNPVYSIYNLLLYATPFEPRINAHLHFMLEPDFTARSAIDPAEKFRQMLPYVFAHWPFLGMNLAAGIGTVLACVRRDRLSWAFAFVALTTSVIVALAYPAGRYFVPFLPVLVTLGAAGWWRFGGRWRIPALLLLAAGPWLPNLPPDFPDVARLRAINAGLRAGIGPELPAVTPVDRAPCLGGRPVVLAEDAARIAWDTDAITIHLPATREDFWQIAGEHAVDFAQMRSWKRVPREELLAHFFRRPECGDDLFERRRPDTPLPGSRSREPTTTQAAPPHG